jgi:hypothetical protein
MSSKFGGFLGDSSRKPADSSAGQVVRPSEGRAADYAAIAKAARAAGRAPQPVSAKPCFAVALDATGSMSNLIEDARRSIGKILDRVYAEASVKVRVRLYVFRDYDVTQGLCDASELSGDTQVLSRWLSSVKTHGGGANAGEAIETALEAIYTADEVSAVLIAGDEPSNPRDTLNAYGHQQKVTAREWAPRFLERRVPIHTFLVGQRTDTKEDFEEIARLSGGQAGRLDGSDAMIHMAVMAMLERISGAVAVEHYKKSNQLSIAAREFSVKLLGPPKAP